MGRTITQTTFARRWQEEQKAQHLSAVYGAIEWAGKRGITRAEIARETGLSSNGVRSRLSDLMDQQKKRVYIVRWIGINSNVCAVYAVGNRPDAEKPNRAGADEDPAMSESMADKSAMERHQEWMAGWKPHCDVAAAWMMGAV